MKISQQNSKKGASTEAEVGFHCLGPNENDPMRHVFRKGTSIYRGISAERAEIVRKLFDSGLIADLVAAGLVINSVLIDRKIGGYALAIEQADLTPPNLTNEMPPSMRRDAGIVLVRLAHILDRRGFALREADLSGFVVNKQGHPVFHNLSAILPKGNQKFPYAEFHANFLAPLSLIDQRPELAALVQRAAIIRLDEDISIRNPWVRGMLRWISKFGKPGQRLLEIYYRLAILSPFGGLLHNGLYGTFVREILREQQHRSRRIETASNWTGALLDKLEKRLRKFEFDQITQRWTDYHSDVGLANIVQANSNWEKHFSGKREKALIQILSEVGSGTLLDVGANGGYFSMLGAHLGFATTAVDYDIGAIDRLYCLLKNAGSPLSIRPFIVDFLALERQHWPRYHADIVFALGFVHHMRRVELLPWAVIAERLAGLTGKVLVTEFKPGTGARVSTKDVTNSIVDDYTLEHLVAALKPHFQSVKIVGDFTAVGSESPRTMLVCRR